MVEGEAKLEKEIRASRAGERDLRRRLQWTASTTASYSLDALLLGLFAVAGTIPAAAFYVFVAGAAALCATTYAVYATGWNLKFRDPNFVWPQTAASVALFLCVVAMAPQVAFPVLTNLFTVFAFGFIWLSLRSSLVLWAFSSAATGTLLWLVGERAGFAAANAADVTISWLFFSAILGRCLLLSVYANDMRTRLAEGRRKLAASLEQVQDLASRDELTRSLNRRSLMAALERELSRAERSGAPFSVGMIDLDLFKSINDTYGHSAGDRALSTFAATVHETMRITDVFGRYGGEEFLIILVGTGPRLAFDAMERIRAAVAARDWSAVTPGRSVTLSSGVASFRKGEPIEQLLHRADTAMYEAKRAGRNRTVLSE